SAAGGGAGPGPGPGLRLHPWSWLFVLLAQLRSFAVPLLALLLFGRGDAQWMQWELLGGAAGGLLALSSVVQYFTYRYGVIGTDLVIRAGLLQRHTRNIPLARIRNVSLHRSVLHRLFGVAEVRLESAGGARAEAHMRVLSLAAAAELERLVQSGATAAAAGTGIGAAGTGSGAAAGDRGEQLLALPIAELVRLGLISNRGMVVVGAGFAALWQLAPGDAGDWIEAVGEWLLGRASALQLGTLATAVGVAVLVAAAVAVLRLLSIVLALVQFHGFRLRLGGEAISVERGLLTHVRGHAPVRK